MRAKALNMILNYDIETLLSLPAAKRDEFRRYLLFKHRDLSCGLPAPPIELFRLIEQSRVRTGCSDG